MQTLTQSVLSTQYVQTLVAVTSADAYDPTGDAVQFAFTNASAFPSVQPSAWTAGEWVTFPGDQYWAQILLGPTGAVTLTNGTWQAWLKISASPETPVLQPFLIQIV